MANENETYGTMMDEERGRFRRQFFRRTKRRATVKKGPSRELDALLLHNRDEEDNVEDDYHCDGDDQTIQTVATSSDATVLSTPDLYESQECGSSKLLDLELLLDLCVVRLKLPSEESSPQKHQNDVATTTTISTRASVSGSNHSFSHFGGRSFWTVSAPKALPSSLSLKLGRAEEEEEEDTRHVSSDKKPRSGCTESLQSVLCIIFRPLSVVWNQTSYRVLIVPILLIATWVLSRVIFSTSFFGPIRFLVDLALPYISLSLSLMCLVVQSWVISSPLARNIINILSQMQSIIDEAFFEMIDHAPRKITNILRKLNIPRVAAENLCRALFIPLKEVLQTILKIMPKVDEVVPSSAREPKSVAFVVFTGLLVTLFLGQALMILVLGTMLNGTMEVILGVTLCCTLAAIALYADSLVPLFLRTIEALLNGIIQSLLRKLLPVSKIQRTLDYIERITPKSQLRRSKNWKQIKRNLLKRKRAAATVC